MECCVYCWLEIDLELEWSEAEVRADGVRVERGG